jgi:hypothetical protein
MEQSERLLALGLKKETADMMYCKTASGELITAKDDDYLEHLDIPAWSLHRLIELLGLSKMCLNIDLYDSPYEEIIRRIDVFIHTGVFNKEYLE